MPCMVMTQQAAAYITGIRQQPPVVGFGQEPLKQPLAIMFLVYKVL